MSGKRSGRSKLGVPSEEPRSSFVAGVDATLTAYGYLNTYTGVGTTKESLFGQPDR